MKSPVRLLALMLLGGCSSPAPTPRQIVDVLTSDALAGRKAGSEGERAAADFVAAEFRRAGLQTHLQTYPGGVNVIGLVAGRSPEVVVVGAHIDHLGKSEAGIYRGADDNASGVAALVAIARRFAAKPAGRNLAFVGFGGEEAGILGSRHYVKSSESPGVAMINMDMVGRMEHRTILCIGTDTSEAWPGLLARAGSFGLEVKTARGGVGPSDQTSFYQAGVPVLHFFTGAHRDYHQPTDTPDKLDYEGLDRVIDLVEAVARQVADAEKAPAWKHSEVELDAGGTPRPGARPYLGAMPDYEFPERMQAADIAPGSPAEKAGLRKGDVIVALDGVEVKDLKDYSDRLFAHRGGDVIQLGVKRGEARIELTATLATRAK